MNTQRTWNQKHIWRRLVVFSPWIEIKHGILTVHTMILPNSLTLLIIFLIANSLRQCLDHKTSSKKKTFWYHSLQVGFHLELTSNISLIYQKCAKSINNSLKKVLGIKSSKIIRSEKSRNREKLKSLLRRKFRKLLRKNCISLQLTLLQRKFLRSNLTLVFSHKTRV